MSKTVFVLGAGFSAPAGMPLQSEIMFDVLRSYSQPVQETTRRIYAILFNIVDPEAMRTVPLEDVFTMLDRANHYGEVIPGFGHREIRDSLVALVQAITDDFQKKLLKCDLSRYRPFFEALVRCRKGDGSVRAQQDDPFSLVSFNWDTIPDHLIMQASDEESGIDYTCYDYDIEEDTNHTPSILRKAKGLFNIKLLKPHGSLNWAKCPSCNRIFSKNCTDCIPILFPQEYKCRFCTKVDLENVMITPTFVKDIGQTHLKLVWHNIQRDLQEAKRIVFLGYSLPLADFEFRYTLLKAVISNSKVALRVVLFPPDSEIQNERQRVEREQTEERFRNFFGQRDVEIKYLNVIDFMSDDYLVWCW
ncbi:hypothetical protein LPW11_07865 [Geomonas sp. RF6]|uniref:hypothetical protein n=1 Tax=Geomonas sp. RF6 TaxID=2897342 RepID=UPI001E487889|nr:hypothetical protein [Geomonas sp. RF6]UFS72097.1 hypothetical protein LPW11_07865 [Geomonas sp. RF6]